MKRDKLEELLHDKLNRMEIEPTSDVWAKLSNELDTTSAEHLEQSAGESYVPQINIRTAGKGKSLGGRRNWMYVAASVAVVAMLIGTMRSFKNEVELEADKYEYTELYNPSDDKVDVAQEQTTDNIPASTRVVVKSLLAVAATESIIEITASIPTEEIDGQPKIDAPATKAESKESKTSDMKTMDVFVAETTNAEFSRPARRTSPINLSLFTSNMGGKDNFKSAGGGAMLTNSGFHVTEDKGGGAAENTNTRNYKHKLPLSFGVSLAFNITPKVSIQTGINYTYMLSEAEIAGMPAVSGAFDYALKQRLHYIGIPLSVKYNFIAGRRVYFYISGGGMLEKGISGRTTYRLISEGRVTSAPASEKVKMKGLQASVMANLGVEVKLSGMFGVYVEPGVSYYFKNSNQPVSYRTENHLNFTIRAGLRMHF